MTKEKFNSEVGKYIMDYSKFSYQFELDRSTSLDGLSSRMIELLSIEIALCAILLSDQMTTCIRAALILALFSFFLTMNSLYRFKYKTLQFPLDMKKEVYEQYEEYSDEEDRVDHFCKAMNALTVSLSSKNDYRIKLLHSSMLMCALSISLILIPILL